MVPGRVRSLLACCSQLHGKGWVVTSSNVAPARGLARYMRCTHLAALCLPCPPTVAVQVWFESAHYKGVEAGRTAAISAGDPQCCFRVRRLDAAATAASKEGS